MAHDTAVPPRRRNGASGTRRRWLAMLALPLIVGAMPAAWTRPLAPFRIAGPIWYVGSEGLAAYLIKTPKGAILIDGTLAENAPMVERNIVAAGVPLRSVRYLLVSHAHYDHAAADAAIKAASGARVIAGAGDRVALEKGYPPGEYLDGHGTAFPRVRVDRVVRDGDRVTLGGTTLVAHATPGHTPGCTSWSMRIVESGKPLDVVFPCSVTVAGNRLVGNRAYPGIVADYRRSFARLEALPADIMLPAHPEFADVIGRHARTPGSVAAYVAPGLLAETTRKAAADFEAELARQQALPR